MNDLLPAKYIFALGKKAKYKTSRDLTFTAELRRLFGAFMGL